MRQMKAKFVYFLLAISDFFIIFKRPSLYSDLPSCKINNLVGGGVGGRDASLFR